MDGVDMSREPMLEMYLFETGHFVEQLEEIIIRWEESRKLDVTEVNEIFRIMHTIKGSSAMMMFNNVSTLAHALEDLFYFIRENRLQDCTLDSVPDLVLAGIDFIKLQVEKIMQNEEIDVETAPEDLIQKIKQQLQLMKEQCGQTAVQPVPRTDENKKSMYYISTYDNPEKKPVYKYFARVFFEDDCQMENIRAYMVVHSLKDIAVELFHYPEDIMDDPDSVGEIRKNGFIIGFGTNAGQPEVQEVFESVAFVKSLEFSQVEEYPEEIGSLMKKSKQDQPADQQTDTAIQESTSLGTEKEITYQEGKSNKQQSMISVNVKKLDMLMDLVGELVISEAMVTRNPDLKGLQLGNFNKAAQQLRKLTDELQDIVMSIRMVPIAMTFQKMHRIIRDMSRKLNKEVELELLGEATEVDKNIIDHLSDPLMHLIRNAVDHGIEARDERINLGKPEKGKVILEAKNTGGDVLISITDDGKGLSREKILAKAKVQGLLNQNDTDLTDEEVFSFILLPGFSTKDTVTEFSGRGVGMDVVKKNIEAVGGSIVIESVMGKGTRILIKIPLTLAIIDGMEVGTGKSRYTIPIASIRETFSMRGMDVIADQDGNEIIMIRGQCYPVFRLDRLFNIKSELQSMKDGIMVMIESGGKAACLFADHLLGEQQVVVKSLPKYINRINGIAGCTILGDGKISLIVDVDALLKTK